jgi:Universal stress protein family
MTRIRRVLHASDFSRDSRAAFTWALDVAKANTAELLVVHILTPTIPMMADAYVASETWEVIERMARTGAQKEMNKLPAAAKKAGVRATGSLLEGVPHEQDRAHGKTQASRPPGSRHPRADGSGEVLSRQCRRTCGRDRTLPSADRSREVSQHVSDPRS